MPTAPETELIQFDDWALRVRRASHLLSSPMEAPRLLLLVHGYTGDENSMWVFAHDLPSHYWIVAPRAPHVAQHGGFSWRPLEMSTFGNPSLEDLSSAAEALIRLVDAYSASAGFEADVFDQMGFSQGAAVCNTLAFLYPQRVRRTGILAGFVPDNLGGLITKRPLEGKPFFVAHGTKDQTVPIDHARASLEILEQAGAQVTFCEDEVGHKVSANCLRALKDFLLK